MIDIETRTRLSALYGEIAEVTQGQLSDLEQLKDEIGIDNLSPTEKANLVTTLETLGGVSRVAAFIHELSPTEPDTSAW